MSIQKKELIINDSIEGFLCFRGNELKDSDLVPVKRGKTREETRRLLLQEFKEAKKQHQAMQHCN